MTMDEMLSLARMLRHVSQKTAAKRSPLPQGVQIESTDADGVNAEWQIVPGASEEKVLLYFHGGGFIAWSAYTHRPLTVALGQATGMRVLSVDYRLAPEYPFPAALDDCTKAYRWLLSRGFKPSDIVIGGDSAGGNLTLTTILNLRDKGVPLPKGGVCISPDTHVISFSRLDTEALMADTGIFWWPTAYLGIENLAQSLNPLACPFRGDLRGLPPLLFQATPPEFLFDNSKQFVEKAKAAGGDVTFQTWDGMVHDFQLVFLGFFPEAQEAIDKIGEWVRKLYTR
jgi:acetyl esterase/lipase